MGTRVHRKADHPTSADAQYIRAIADFRDDQQIPAYRVHRLRSGGRRAADGAWGGASEDARPVNKTAMSFAWAAVMAAWFGGMALIALLRSSGVL